MQTKWGGGGGGKYSVEWRRETCNNIRCTCTNHHENVASSSWPMPAPIFSRAQKRASLLLLQEIRKKETAMSTVLASLSQQNQNDLPFFSLFLIVPPIPQALRANHVAHHAPTASCRRLIASSPIRESACARMCVQEEDIESLSSSFHFLNDNPFFHS